MEENHEFIPLDLSLDKQVFYINQILIILKYIAIIHSTILAILKLYVSAVPISISRYK